MGMLHMLLPNAHKNTITNAHKYTEKSQLGHVPGNVAHVVAKCTQKYKYNCT